MKSWQQLNQQNVSTLKRNNGFHFFKNYLDFQTQLQIILDIETLLKTTEPFINFTRYGRPYNVTNANAGEYGWFSDTTGYHYSKTHPETGLPWPAIPKNILNVVSGLVNLTGYQNFKPESCYINFYSAKSTLGLHQDNSEKNLSAPIISISLGSSAIFELGGLNKKDKTEKIILESGDCYVQGGDSRLYYHGINKIIPNSSKLIPDDGRINLTIRQVY